MLVHLLIPKEHRVWCMKKRQLAVHVKVTTLPSEATCCNCLTAWRSTTQKNYRPFQPYHTPRTRAELDL